ncbi:MAG: TIGR01459 family HAD-type hydrolase [Pseudomonadota bacterium]
MIPVITSAHTLASDYDAWLCDIWGVVHNGRDPFVAAAEALVAYRAQGGTVVLITNAPRPNTEVAEQLVYYHLPDEAYDAIVTSGDVTRHLITERAGKPIFHLGPERDRPVFAGLDVTLVKADAAELIVNTGLFDDYTETPEDYRERLTAFHERGVPMICANPDLVVERGAEIVHCAGGLAVLYEEIGGQVIYAGKPHLPIYDLCRDRIRAARGMVPDNSRILAIGDGLKTDVRGAHAAGLDCLFVPSGIHLQPGQKRDQATLDGLFEGAEKKPVAAINGLSWSVAA